jgi:antitoxin component of MazEF toxin-antitoxin module
MNMLSKATYAVQPYQVGRKNKKSLVVVIPAKIAKECNIDTSTIFAIQLGNHKKKITLQMVDAPREKEIIPAAESFEASSKQASQVQ